MPTQAPDHIFKEQQEKRDLLYSIKQILQTAESTYFYQSNLSITDLKKSLQNIQSLTVNALNK